MPRYFLLDTNAAIAAINGDSALLVVTQTADQLFVSSVVLGELYFGAENSAKREKNMQTVEQFARDGHILSCDAETARWFGKIRKQLMVKGRPIPVNDLWIAATALQHNLALVTRDAHFAHVETLTTETW